jgi:transcriptional regulator with XRE-family HTH domain
MTDPKTREIAAEASRRTRELCARIGGELRRSRRRRRMSQATVARIAGVSQSAVSRFEAGRAPHTSVELLIRVALILEQTVRVELSRDPREEPADAGHLAIQELALRLARQTGRRATFELATKPAEPWRSTDVGIRDDSHRVLILLECWNTMGDVGSAARATTRKMAEAEQLAVVFGGEEPYRVAGCWVMRATSRNRELVARYPEVFAALSWIVGRLGRGTHARSQTAGRTGARLGGCDRHASVPVEETRYAAMTERMMSSRRSRTTGSATPAASISARASSR